MPLNLAPRDVADELTDASSVLIVYCPVGPPVSLAMLREAPLMDLLTGGFRTGAFEDHIAEIRDDLRQRGVRTGVFFTYAPIPTMCLWSRGQRARLRKRAEGYDAALVLGCDSATHTARQVLAETTCRVIQGMDIVGISNARLEYEFPAKINLAHPSTVSTRKGTADKETHT